MWSELKQALDSRKTFVLTTHVSPDGDGLGAQLALQEYLQSLGKTVHVVNADPVSHRYAFLERDGSFLADSPEARKLVESADATIFVDTASWSQLGSLENFIRNTHSFRIAIDHHPAGDLEADLMVRNIEAAATCELLYDFLQAVDFPITRSMASALFVGIATDTGWFRYANATPRVFEITAALCDGGARCSKLYHLIYEQDLIERLRLLGKALATISADADGQVIYFYVSHAVFEEVGVGESYTESFISYARLIRGGKIIILFKETEPGVIHVSFRSRGDVDVRAIARELGGGGHHNASGATAHGELQTVIRDVLSRARRALAVS